MPEETYRLYLTPDEKPADVCLETELKGIEPFTKTVTKDSKGIVEGALLVVEHSEKESIFRIDLIIKYDTDNHTRLYGREV